MGMKEKMVEWISKHPDATVEEAWTAGYFCSTDAWCHGKVELMDKCAEILKQIIDR